jgi:hypothetical protein
MGQEYRKSPRRSVHQPAVMVGRDGSILGACTMSNVSAGGARLEPRNAVTVPDSFTLLLSPTGSLRRQCKVVWRSETAIGVRFLSSGAVRRVDVR